ncbi:PucR family transcriptional regulator [Mitsuokella sp. WILCCON 0060]|uniref:PucR family transcriptional regulator n=1 Tax=Mitsuokella sp. WILCCON 0060 TaxID=3345341 RepID=UPI003F1DE153
MPTISWLIKESGLSSLRLLTGLSHGEQIIRSVNVLDNPDVLKWFQKDEFILTTGYVFKDSPELQKSIIRNMKEIGCAGLGVKVRRFFRTVPVPLLEEASRLDFPVVELPFFYGFSTISQCIFEEIYREKLRGEGVDELTSDEHPAAASAEIPDPDISLSGGQGRAYFLQALFHSRGRRGINELKSLCAFYGFDYRKAWICLAMPLPDDPDERRKLLPILQENIPQHVPEGATLFLCHSDNLCVFFLLFPSSCHRLHAMHEVKHAMQELKEDLKAKGISLPIGLSGCHRRVEDLAESLKESLRAMNLARELGQDGPADYLTQLPLHFLSNQPEPSHLALLLRMNILKPLLDYDAANGAELVETLKAYFQHNYNAAATAKALYLHRNTMTNRLEKIRELLDTDFSNADENFLIYLSLLSHEQE